MTNALYGLAREAFLNADIDWLVDDIRAILVDTGAYTVSIDVHDFLDDVPVGSRIATSTALTGKTSTLGVADANDVTFPLVSGVTIEAIILYKHTGVEGTSRLIAYIDVATGLPTLPNGADIVVVWDNGVLKIFRL